MEKSHNLSALSHAQAYADSCAVADPELRRFIINAFCAGFDKSAAEYKGAMAFQNNLVREHIAEIAALKKKINIINHRNRSYEMRKNSDHQKGNQE